MNATALGAGHCGVTESVQGNSCDTDARSGSFGATIHGMHLRTLSDCAAACLRWCARCNYVSFSPLLFLTQVLSSFVPTYYSVIIVEFFSTIRITCVVGYDVTAINPVHDTV